MTSEKDKIWKDYLNMGFADRIVTIGYFSLIDSTKVELTVHNRNASWFPVDEIPDLEMAFDHKQIFYKALEALRKKVKG